MFKTSAIHPPPNKLGGGLLAEDDKKTYLVNALWQSMGPQYDHILKRLDYISVRDTRSQLELQRRHGITANINMDLSYWHPIAEDTPALNFNNSIVVGDFFETTLIPGFIIFRQKTPTQQVGWGMNGAGFEHIVLQPLMRLLHNCQHSSFCSKSFLWKGIDPN